LASRRSTLGLALLGLGAVVFVVALYYSNPLLILDYVNGYLYCNEECYFLGILDFVAAAVGAIMMLVGAMVLIERLLPSEPV
jgi:hypothetical protein